LVINVSKKWKYPSEDLAHPHSLSHTPIRSHSSLSLSTHKEEHVELVRERKEAEEKEEVEKKEEKEKISISLSSIRSI
jgi:hypothetical protein